METECKCGVYCIFCACEWRERVQGQWVDGIGDGGSDYDVNFVTMSWWGSVSCVYVR
jgi:hypothetical protein